MGPVPIEGFNPKFKPLTSFGSEIWMHAMFSEAEKTKSGEDIFELPEKMTPTMQIIQKRIDVMELPIKFTAAALVATVGLSEENPGRAVTILIDCLRKFPEGEVDTEKLSLLYPTGFYDDQTFADYIDNYLKPRKIEWAKIY